MATSTLTHGRVIWTNIAAVDKQDSKLLRAAHPSFPPCDLANPLSRIERPRIDEYDDDLFAGMQFPIRDAARRIRRAAEVNLSIGEGSLVTVHEDVLMLLNTLFAFIRKELDVYWGHIIDHLQKASGLLAGHDEANCILTVISVIMLPLALISSIYGMNAALPRDENPHAFIEILLMMLFIMLAMPAVFKRKNRL